MTLFGKRILVLAAHPDDEIVACCAAMERAKRQGAKIFVLFLTHGCIAQETLWPWQRHAYVSNVARRRAEAEQAARALGVTALDWPERPARHLWRHMADVYNEIKRAVNAHAIDQLWTPAYEGGNADHDALNAVGHVLSASKEPGFVLEFAEYNFFEGRARSHEFPYPNGTEQTLSLSPEEQGAKRAALKLYASEQRNLGYVGTARECFRPLAAYDYAKPPHPGTLWYTRFHWVPFHHPRVDFTKPAKVSEAITHFVESTY